MPKDSVGYAVQAESALRTQDAEIMELLTDGYQVSLKNAFTYHLSITARLDSSDDPPPPDQKLPVSAGAEDTALGLNNVLNPSGLLRLTGRHRPVL